MFVSTALNADHVLTDAMSHYRQRGLSSTGLLWLKHDGKVNRTGTGLSSVRWDQVLLLYKTSPLKFYLRGDINGCDRLFERRQVVYLTMQMYRWRRAPAQKR